MSLDILFQNRANEQGRTNIGDWYTGVSNHDDDHEDDRQHLADNVAKIPAAG